MAEKIKNRVPTKPNRKKITYDDGRVEYAKVEYADEPVEIGTAMTTEIMATTAEPNTLAMRDGSGRMQVADGVADGDVVNKKMLNKYGRNIGDIFTTFTDSKNPTNPNLLPANGGYAEKALYPELFNKIGYTFGNPAFENKVSYSNAEIICKCYSGFQFGNDIYTAVGLTNNRVGVSKNNGNGETVIYSQPGILSYDNGRAAYCFKGKLFFILDKFGYGVMSDDLGATWKSLSTLLENVIAVKVFKNKVIAVCKNSSKMYYSLDGINFTMCNISNISNYISFDYVNGSDDIAVGNTSIYIPCCENSSGTKNAILKSTDGVNFDVKTANIYFDSNNSLSSIACNENETVFYSLTNKEHYRSSIRRSTDCENWTSYYIRDTIYFLKYYNGFFVHSQYYGQSINERGLFIAEAISGNETFIKTDEQHRGIYFMNNKAITENAGNIINKFDFNTNQFKLPHMVIGAGSSTQSPDQYKSYIQAK